MYPVAETATGAMAGAVIASCLIPAVRKTCQPHRRHDDAPPTGWSQRETATVAASAATAGLVAWHLSYGTTWWAFVIVASLSPSLAVIDATVRRLPFWLTIPAGGIGASCLIAIVLADQTGLPVLLRAMGAAIAVGLTFLVLAVLTTDGMGGGDVVLAAVIAFYLSWLGWNSLTKGLISGLLAAAVGAGLKVLATRSAKTPIPLGPFLLAGWFVGVLTT